MLEPTVLKFTGESNDAYLYNYMTSKQPMFAWANRDGNKVKKITAFYYCRELFTTYINNNLMGNEHYTYIDRPIERGKIQLIIIMRKMYDKNRFDRVQSCINLLNVIERYYGWEESDAYNIKHVSKKIETDKLHNMYIIGTKKWMKSIHMISLLILILRVGSCYNFSQIANFKDLIKEIQKDPDKIFSKSTSERKYMVDDWEKLTRILPKYTNIIMGDYNNLFKGFSFKYLYNDTLYINQEGISSLCDNTTEYTRLGNRLNFLYKDKKSSKSKGKFNAKV